MFVVNVSIRVKPDKIEEFKEATRRNHEGSVKEPGCLRFDALQGAEDETLFCLYEVYRAAADLDAHRETEHFKRWRETAEPLMAEPRTRIFYNSVFPDPWE
jgi:quinol monooxygenase YgiN